MPLGLVAIWGIDLIHGPMKRIQDMTKEVCAGMVREAARQYRAAYKHMKGLEVTISQDCHDLRRVASLIRKGQLEAAKDAICSLDTLVRDSISREVWVFLCGDES